MRFDAILWPATGQNRRDTSRAADTRDDDKHRGNDRISQIRRIHTQGERMKIIRHPKDFAAGLLFAAVGVAAVVIAANYPLGTAARMGPGYFPRILGILLIVLGSALALRALKLQGAPIPRWHWKPIVIVLGSVVLFGAIVNSVGLALSTVILIVLASSASPEFRPKESIISGIALAALSVAVFVIALKLQLPIWPQFD
jgi:hypothetical protein